MTGVLWPGATVPPRKLARNFPWSVFDVPRKRWNCNDSISKFERRVGELRATFVGNHAGVPRPRREPLAGNLYFLGLAVDSRIVRTGLKVWRCLGCSEDLVDEVDTLWRGQEWAVLGAWRISSERIGIPFTGLDALIRHFNEHPEDRPLLATPQGVDLVNDILAQAHAALTTPQRSHT